VGVFAHGVAARLALPRSLQERAMTEQRHIFSASDLAQFEYCSLAWWYEEFSDLAQADQEELAQRLEELVAEDAATASAQPEYVVIERLLDRAIQFAAGREQQAKVAAQQIHPAEEPTISAPAPRIFSVVVVGLVLLLVFLLGLGMLVLVR
jgi:hypothetical protein